MIINDLFNSLTNMNELESSEFKSFTVEILNENA